MHHGGNFQAMAVTNAMEKTRLAIHHMGKLLFAQCTELINPAMNRGLPPNLASTDPSHNYFAKGVDIHTAAYVGELGYLAPPNPPSELERRRALYKYNIWNTTRDPNFDRIAHLVKLVFSTRIVMIALIDGAEQ